MRKMTMLICGVVAGGLMAGAVAAQDLTPVTLTTGWVINGGSASLVLADDRGYFRDGGVNVDIVRGYGSGDVVAKVAAGTYQAGTGSLPALVQAIADNPDLDAIAVMISFDAAPDAVVGPRATGITTPADLAGRKISTQPNSTSMRIFAPFAKAVGLADGDVEWVEVSPELVGVVVQQGQADGAAQFAASALANFSRLGYEAEDLYVFKFSDYVENLYGNGLILQKSWAAANPDAAKAVVAAYARGLIESSQEPEAAIDAVMAREPLLTREIEMGDLVYTNENYHFTPAVMEKGLAYHSAENVQGFIDLLAGPFGLSRVPDASEVFTDAYLPPADVLKVPQ